jgi:hypothetical protein
VTAKKNEWGKSHLKLRIFTEQVPEGIRALIMLKINSPLVLDLKRSLI